MARTTPRDFALTGWLAGLVLATACTLNPQPEPPGLVSRAAPDGGNGGGGAITTGGSGGSIGPPFGDTGSGGRGADSGVAIPDAAGSGIDAAASDAPLLDAGADQHTPGEADAPRGMDGSDGPIGSDASLDGAGGPKDGGEPDTLPE